MVRVEPVGYHARAGDRVGLFVLGEPPTLRLADPATGAVRVVAREIGRSLQSVPGRSAISYTAPTDARWVIGSLLDGLSTVAEGLLGG